MAALAAALLVAVLSPLWTSWLWYPTYTTQIAEERTITLPDTSTVRMNARSKIRVVYTESKRELELLEGQALFKVAKDSNRPFYVTSGDATVLAVGTQFDVYRKSDQTVVTVVEGRVNVSGPGRLLLADSDTRSAATTVDAGEQLFISAAHVSKPVHKDTAAATAWVQGNMVFDNTSMYEVIQEVNRYSTRTVEVTDPSLLSLHVSGAFPTNDCSKLVRFLAGRFELQVHESGRHIVLSRE